MGLTILPVLLTCTTLNVKKNVNHGNELKNLNWWVDPGFRNEPSTIRSTVIFLGTKHQVNKKHGIWCDGPTPHPQPINGVLSLLGAQQWMGPGLAIAAPGKQRTVSPKKIGGCPTPWKITLPKTNIAPENGWLEY